MQHLFNQRSLLLIGAQLVAICQIAIVVVVSFRITSSSSLSSSSNKIFNSNEEKRSMPKFRIIEATSPLIMEQQQRQFIFKTQDHQKTNTTNRLQDYDDNNLPPSTTMNNHQVPAARVQRPAFKYNATSDSQLGRSVELVARSKYSLLNESHDLSPLMSTPPVPLVAHETINQEPHQQQQQHIVMHEQKKRVKDLRGRRRPSYKKSSELIRTQHSARTLAPLQRRDSEQQIQQLTPNQQLRKYKFRSTTEAPANEFFELISSAHSPLAFNYHRAQLFGRNRLSQSSFQYDQQQQQHHHHHQQQQSNAPNDRSPDADRQQVNSITLPSSGRTNSATTSTTTQPINSKSVNDFDLTIVELHPIRHQGSPPTAAEHSADHYVSREMLHSISGSNIITHRTADSQLNSSQSKVPPGSVTSAEIEVRGEDNDLAPLPAADNIDDHLNEITKDTDANEHHHHHHHDQDSDRPTKAAGNANTLLIVGHPISRPPTEQAIGGGARRHHLIEYTIKQPASVGKRQKPVTIVRYSPAKRRRVPANNTTTTTTTTKITTTTTTTTKAPAHQHQHNVIVIPDKLTVSEFPTGTPPPPTLAPHLVRMIAKQRHKFDENITSLPLIVIDNDTFRLPQNTTAVHNNRLLVRLKSGRPPPARFQHTTEYPYYNPVAGITPPYPSSSPTRASRPPPPQPHGSHYGLMNKQPGTNSSSSSSGVTSNAKLPPPPNFGAPNVQFPAEAPSSDLLSAGGDGGAAAGPLDRPDKMNISVPESAHLVGPNRVPDKINLDAGEQISLERPPQADALVISDSTHVVARPPYGTTTTNQGGIMRLTSTRKPTRPQTTTKRINIVSANTTVITTNPDQLHDVMSNVIMGSHQHNNANQPYRPDQKPGFFASIANLFNASVTTSAIALLTLIKTILIAVLLMFLPPIALTAAIMQAINIG